MDIDDWTCERVKYLKALKSRTDQQALLVLLAENSTRTTQENKKLAMLVKAEKASLRAARACQEIATLLAAEKRNASQAERKVRNHRLIQQGLLFDLAGLSQRTRGELLGILVAASATEDPQRWATWKDKGDALLARLNTTATQVNGKAKNGGKQSEISRGHVD